MITIVNEQQYVPIEQEQVRLLVHGMLHEIGYVDFDIGFLFVTLDNMQAYNKKYRDKNKPTDILSFPFHPDKMPGERIEVANDDEKNLGDIIICPEFVNLDAEQQWGCSFQERLVVLLAHGIAHLLNYDHQSDEEYEEMNCIEQRLIAAANNYTKKNHGEENK